MNRTREKIIRIGASVFTAFFMAVFLLWPGNVFSKELMSTRTTIGDDGETVSLLLYDIASIDVVIPDEAFEKKVDFTLSETDFSYLPNKTVTIFSVDFQDLQKPLLAKVFPLHGIDADRQEMITVYRLVELNGGRKYWKRAGPFSIGENDSIDFWIQQAGVYKVEYAIIKLGGAASQKRFIDPDRQGFFKLNKPVSASNPLDFSLKFYATMVR